MRASAGELAANHHPLTKPKPSRRLEKTHSRMAAALRASSNDEASTSSSSSLVKDTDKDMKDSIQSKAKRMWTRADRFHAHSVSGGLYSVLGFDVMYEWCRNDYGAIFGGEMSKSALVGEATTLTTGVGDWSVAASISVLLATACALSGIPLAQNKGWRKQELSLRSIAFQLVMTWQLCRLNSGEALAPLDAIALYGCALPFVWHTLTYIYVFFVTEDDKRSVLLVWLGVLLFSLQLVPTALAIQHGDLLNLREGLPQMWEHSLFGLIWLLNWSTFGASLKARNVVDDVDFRKWFLIRPSALWMLMYVLDTTRYHPFSSVGDYAFTLAGALVA